MLLVLLETVKKGENGHLNLIRKPFWTEIGKLIKYLVLKTDQPTDQPTEK